VFLRIKPLTILATGRLFGTEDGFEGRWDSNGFLFNDAFKEGVTDSSTGTIAINQWQSVLFTWGGGENAITLDGVEVLTQTGADDDPGSGTLMVGTRFGSTETVHALVSAIYVWDRVLTADETALISNDPWVMFRNLVGRAAPATVLLPIDTPTPTVEVTRLIATTPVELVLGVPTPAEVLSTTTLTPNPLDLPLLVLDGELVAGAPRDAEPDPLALPLDYPDAFIVVAHADFTPDPVPISLEVLIPTTRLQAGPTILARPPVGTGTPRVPVATATHRSPEG
jgi:hypothetical protein